MHLGRRSAGRVDKVDAQNWSLLRWSSLSILPPTRLANRYSAAVFYTPGWGAILPLAGTVVGASITQLANTAASRATTRKERDSRLTDAVGDLIASANTLIAEAGTFESDMLKLIEVDAAEAKRDALFQEKTDGMVAALLEISRYEARIQLMGGEAVSKVVDSLREAILQIVDSVHENVKSARARNSAEKINSTTGPPATLLLKQLVAETRSLTEHRSAFSKARSRFKLGAERDTAKH